MRGTSTNRASTVAAVPTALPLRSPLKRTADKPILLRYGLFAIALFAANAQATLPAVPRAEFDGPLGSRVRLEVTNRIRGEFWSFFETAPTSTLPNYEYDFLGNRFQLGVRATRDPFEVFAQFQDSLIYPAPEEAPGAGGAYYLNTRRRTLHEAIFRQGWVRWKNAFGVPGLTLTPGRQLYRDGLEAPAASPALSWLQRYRIAERLIGPFDYTHVGRSFDGGQASWDREWANVTAFGFVPTAGGYEVQANREIPNVALAGMALALRESKAVPGTIGRFFYVYYDDHRPIVFLDNRPLDARTADKGEGAAIHTIGANAVHVRDLGPGDIDLLAWGAAQVGDWQRQTHAAWAYALEAGYQLPDLWSTPWLRLGYNAGSGDTDPGDDEHGTFFQLLPTARLYAQFPFYNLMNSQDLFVQLLARPHRTLALRTDLHYLRVSSSRDLLYAGAGATSQHFFGYGGTPTTGRTDVAWITDVALTFTPAEWLTFYAYYGHAFGQGVIAGAYLANDADYGYLEVTLSF